jgi:hypothetical protein
MNQIRSKRLLSVDLFRGFLMFILIFIHPLLQRVFSQNNAAFAEILPKIPIWAIILASPLVIIATWGCAFTFLAGIATAYQMTTKFQNSPTDRSLIQLTRSRIVTSCLIIFIQICFNLLFTNKSPDFGTRSIITGLLEFGSMAEFSFITLLNSGTLESIAITTAVLALILRNLWRDGHFQPKKAIANLFFLTIVAMGIAMLAEYIEPDPMGFALTLFHQGDLESKLIALVYMRLYAIRFSFFPTFSFTAMGGIFGIILGARYSRKSILTVGLAGFLLGFSIFVGYALSGFDLIAHFTSEHSPLMLHGINFALQTLVITSLMLLLDYKTNRINQSPKFQTTYKMFDRYSATSLTIFVIEPLFSIIWVRIFQLFYNGPLASDLGIMLSFELMIIFTWYILLRLWKHFEFKYSFEWIIDHLKDLILKLITKIELYFSKSDSKSTKVPQLLDPVPIDASKVIPITQLH